MPNKITKPTNNYVEENKSLITGNSESLYPVIVGEMMLESRESWNQEKYVFAIKNALLVKGLSQWCIGMFTFESLKKWSDLTYKEVAKSLDIKPETLEMYTRVYSYYAKYQPNFIPPVEYSFEFLRSVATVSKKFKKNPIKELERLASIGIVKNAKLAYENIRWTVNPKEWLKPLPEFVLEWNKDKTAILPKIVGKEELIQPFMLCVNWEKFERHYFEITGEVLDLSEIKNTVKRERLRLRIDKPENII